MEEDVTYKLDTKNSKPRNTMTDAVSIIESKYPQMTDEYKRIMWEGYETFCKKQLNYGPTNISVGTNLETDDDVKLSITGLWFRVFDKISRLKQLIIFNTPDAVGESIDDTLQDLGVYAVIAQLVRRKKWAK